MNDSNNPISGYKAIRAFRDYHIENWVRRLTFVEYGRRGGVYNHTNGSIDGRMSIDSVAGSFILSTRLHFGENISSSGFSATHELRSFSLHAEDYGDLLQFYTVADGSIAILRGFTRNGWRVDVFAHARH